MAALMRGVIVGVQCFPNPRGSHSVECARFVRALRRQPVKVLFPQNTKNQDVAQTEAAGKRGVERRVRSGLDGKQAGSATPHAQRERRDAQAAADKYDLKGLRYEKARDGDKRLARLVGVARSRKYREQQGMVLLEGRRLICDALHAGAVPHTLFFSNIQRLCELPLDKLRRASLVKVAFEEIRIWSDLVTPQGVLGIFSRPDPEKLQFPQERQGHVLPIYLVCDNVRDPGNLGTILRSAAAAGCQRVLLTKGCVDVWEPKVLRSAMGAHFRLPVISGLTWDHLHKLLPAQVKVNVADSGIAVATTDELEDEGGERRPLPSGKASEYGWVRSRTKARSRDWDSSDDDDEGDDDDDEETRLCSLALHSQPYHQHWAERDTALVIGGETHGLSLEAVQLAQQTDGRRLFVPMVPGVDSLNSAMAASVLLFEGRRQMMAHVERKSRAEML